MMPKRPNLPAGDPRLIATYRFQFIAYTIRHAGFGIPLLVFFSVMSFRSEAAPLGWAFAAFALIYGPFVLFNIRKLYVAWQSNVAVRRKLDAAANGSGSMTAASARVSGS